MWLRYQVEGYTEDIVHDLEHRLDMIFGRQVNRVHVLDFARLTGEMRQALTNRMGMVYTGDVGQELFTSHAWRRLFEIRGSLVWEFMLEFFSTCRMSYTELRLDEVDTLCFQLGGALAFRIRRGTPRGGRVELVCQGGYFIGRLAAHFGLVSDEGL
ncbi:hypothetical protein Tco_1230671, partial [Tanacetum coccineum]